MVYYLGPLWLMFVQGQLKDPFCYSKEGHCQYLVWVLGVCTQCASHSGLFPVHRLVNHTVKSISLKPYLAICNQRTTIMSLLLLSALFIHSYIFFTLHALFRYIYISLIICYISSPLIQYLFNDFTLYFISMFLIHHPVFVVNTQS